MIGNFISVAVVTAGFVLALGFAYREYDLATVIILGFAAILGLLTEILATLKPEDPDEFLSG